MPRKLVFENVSGPWSTVDFDSVTLTKVSWENAPKHALAFVFFGHVTVDFDGSPTAYGPSEKNPDDDLGNAGNTSQGWFGVAKRPAADPLVQNRTIKIDQTAPKLQGAFPVVQQAKNGDPKPGYYVSTVSRWVLAGQRSGPDYLQNSYPDSSKVAIAAWDGKLQDLGVNIGDYGMAIRHDSVGLYSGYYFLDFGGSKFHLGECSHRVGKDLGGSGRAGGFDNNYPTSFIIFPGHGPGSLTKAGAAAASMVAWRDRSDSMIKQGIEPRLFEMSQASNAKDLILLMGFNETRPQTVPQGLKKLRDHQKTGKGFPPNWASIAGALYDYGFRFTQVAPKRALIF